jgi:hypothetical protein
MSRLTGMQIFELMSDMRDHLIEESILPSWLGGNAPTASGAIILEEPSAAPTKRKARRDRKRAVILPLWFGKGGWLAATLALLVAAGLAVTLFALRDGRVDDPKDTEGESVTEALEEMSGFAAADRLLSQLLIPAEGGELGITSHTDIRRVTEEEGITVGFREQYKGALVLQGKQFRLNRTPFGLEEEVYLYDGSMLYVETLEGQTKSPMNDTELDTLLAHLRSEQNLPDQTKTFTAEELFETVTVIPPSASGTVTVVCKGLKRTAIKELVPILRPILESLNLVNGYTLDGAGNLVRDNEAADGQTRIILFALAAGDLTVTLTATEDGVLKKLETSAEFEAEIENVSVEYEIIGWSTFQFAVNSVKPTVSMEKFKQVHWRTVFGCENAESLGLVPDKNGVYHITQRNSELWDKQIQYVQEHSEEFMGKTFHVVGYLRGSGGKLGVNKFISHIFSNIDGYAPMILTAEQDYAAQDAFRGKPNPWCEIYATVATDYVSIDKQTGMVFDVESLEIP